MCHNQRLISLIACLAALAMCIPCHAGGLLRNGDFEKGLAGWKGYHHGRGTPSVLTQSPNAHSGASSLQAQTPGKHPLEGPVTRCGGLEIGAAYRVAVWVKGAGTVMLATNCGGWKYGKKGALTDSWEKREVQFVAKTTAVSIDIITTGKAPQKVTFWVDDVDVAKVVDENPLPASDVAPIYFEAEDYLGNAKRVEDSDAFGGAATEGTRWYVFMQDVPFPRTSSLVHVYVRARTSHPGKDYPLGLRKGKATVQTAPLTAADKYTWVRFPKPVSAREIGDAFSINTTGPDKRATIRVDGCIVATDGKLTDGQLDATAKVVPGKALLTVGTALKAPIIDGAIDDPCWQHAIEVTPFTVAQNESLAKEQTRAYITRDAENLYLALHCDAMVLDPVNNRLDAFRKTVRENDKAALFKDDYLAILIDSDGNPQTFYDLFVNPNGAVNDAKCAPPDPWGGRDTQWNCNARIASRTPKGVWTVEIAIPFASLGGAPQPGARWHVCIGRKNQAQKETSSWVPLSTGFHNPEDFAALRFSDVVPGMRDLDLGGFARGDNTASARVLSSEKQIPVRLTMELALEKGPVQRVSQTAVIGETAPLRIAYTLKSDGFLRARVSLVDPATLQPWLSSPAWPQRVRSNLLEARIEGKSAVLYVNGRKSDGDAPLVQGENVIAIETQGPVSGTFRVRDHSFTIDDTWLVSESVDDGWNEVGFAAKGWKRVSANGWQGGKAFLRKRLLVNTSRFWPNWEQYGIWLAEDTAQQIFFAPEGVPDTTLSDFRLVVEVPSPLRILGASGFYGVWDLKAGAPEELTRDGKKWARTEIAFAKPMKRRAGLRHHEHVAVVIDVPRGASAANPSEIRYCARAEQGHVSEIPQALKVNILPPVKGHQPAKYVIQMWDGYLARMDDSELQRPVVAGMIRCGVNEMRLRPEGLNIRKFQLIDFNGWNLNGLPWLEAHPDQAVITHLGESVYNPKNQRLNQICTTLLLEDSPAWHHIEKAVAEYVEKRAPDHINWDYESSPFSSYLACYCPRCLAAFRKGAGISDSTQLTPASIKKDHADAWMRFMHHRFADLAGKLNHAAKKAKPDVVFSVYSGYQSERTFEHYGVDWRLLADKIDLAMCGYGRPPEGLKATLDALGNTPLVTGKIVRPYRTSERMYPGFASHATLLRRCLDSTRGVLIYTLTELDGRTFHAIGETSRLIAAHEDFFLKHERADDLVTVKGIHPGDCAVLADGNRRLVVLLNESAKDATVTLTHKDLPEQTTVYNFYGGKDLGHAVSHQATVPAHGAAAFIVAPR